MTTPLHGLVVLDLSSGPAAGLATMMLADFGAHVLRFEDPEYRELNDSPAATMWLRGKVAASVPVHDAAATADVLVISSPHGFSACDFDTLHRLNPALVYAEVSAMGAHQPAPLCEPVVAARFGRMKSMDGILKAPGPRYAAVQVATHATSQNLLAGILAALHERGRSGIGQKITTSLAHGLIPYDQGASIAMQVRRKLGEPEPLVDPASVMPTLNYHPVQCADGRWIQLGNLLPHLFESFMNAIGLGDELIRLRADPGLVEEVRDRILLTMQTRTSAEWMSLFVDDGGIAAHPYQTAAEALFDPDMIANGHVITLGDSQQLGPVARLTATPAEPTGPAKPATGWPRPDKPDLAETTAPLRGIKVIELATIIAAPLAASFLADLGARVIKVESMGGDPYRGMAGGFGAIRCNQGKESLGVDLKSGAGQAIVHKLVADADIVIHNFRPGVPERLGIDYKTLAAIKPDLIYLSANGYGANGPGALRPSTHPIPGAAMGGAGYQAGGTPAALLPLPELREAARRLMRANEVNPDPNTAMVIASSALLGLIARERTGAGQEIFGDMFIANAYANFDGFISRPDRPARPPLDEHLLGTTPVNRLYESSDGWIFLGLRRRVEWERFCTLTKQSHLLSLHPDPVHGDTDGLAPELTALFLTETAAHWESLLLAAGVGCANAAIGPLPEIFFNECKPGSDWMVAVEHPGWGTYYRHVPMVGFSRSRLRPGPGVTGGANTRALMQELGYPAAEVDELYAASVLWSEHVKKT